MKPKDFVNAFFNLWKAEKLGHFHILQGLIGDGDQHPLRTAVTDFLEEVLGHELSLSPEQAKQILSNGHSDVLWVEKSLGKGQNFSVNDPALKEMLTAIQFQPLQLKKRFVIFPQGEQIGEIVSNKLLKTLEELRGDTIILFLAPLGTPFIKTVVSRASFWTLDREIEDLPYQNYKSLQQFPQSSHDIFQLPLAEQIKKVGKAIPFKEFIDLHLDYHRNHQLSARHKDHLLGLLRHYTKESVYNGSEGALIAELSRLTKA